MSQFQFCQNLRAFWSKLFSLEITLKNVTFKCLSITGKVNKSHSSIIFWTIYHSFMVNITLKKMSICFKLQKWNKKFLMFTDFVNSQSFKKSWFCKKVLEMKTLPMLLSLTRPSILMVSLGQNQIVMKAGKHFLTIFLQPFPWSVGCTVDSMTSWQTQREILCRGKIRKIVLRKKVRNKSDDRDDVTLVTKTRRRGIFGFQPGIFGVTQLIVNENILFSDLERTFQKQFCVSFQN